MKNFGIIFFSIVLLVGCGHDHSSHDHGNACDDSTDVLPFELGKPLTSSDGKYSLTIDSSEPNPIGRGNNSWGLTLKDDAGNAVSDTKLVLEPFMPDHEHGTFPALFLGKTSDVVGSYQLGPFDLIMPGTWLMTFTITDADQASSTITVSYCIGS